MYPPAKARARSRTALLIAVCGVILVGCGRGGDTQTSGTKGSQVAARVGDEVITIQELDNEFRLANIPADKQKEPETLKRVMGELVVRKYLYHQAITSKLDREPTVLLDVERAKEGALANAAISRTVASKASAIGPTEINKYITSNPLKFANRHLLNAEQITFPATANFQTIVDSTRDKSSLDAVDQQLTAMNVAHTRSKGTFYSGDIPENLFNEMHAKKPGDVFFVRAGGNGMFIVINSEEARPLEGEAATNLARQALRSDLFKSEMGMASVAANLEVKYEGDYARLLGQPAADAAQK
jgi:EpsD family peptidyl-prolyl cis-trans isomerase